MSDSTPGLDYDGGIAPQKRVRNKARYIRKPNTYKRLPIRNDFGLTDGFVQDAVQRGLDDLSLFRYNVLYVSHHRKIPFTQLIGELNKSGVKVSRTSFIGKIVKHTFPKSLLLSTFALALGVPTWLLLSDNIELDSQRLKVF